MSTPFLRKLYLCFFWQILANRLRTLSLICIKTIPRLEGAEPSTADRAGRRGGSGPLPASAGCAVPAPVPPSALAWWFRQLIGGPGPAPPVLRPAGGPVRLPRAPAVRRSARGFCGLLAPVGPSVVPPERRAPSGLRPPASACRRLRSPVARVRAAPRRPRRSGAGSPSARSGPPAGVGGPLSAAGSPWPFSPPGRPGPPARPAASGGGFALAPPARGRGATAPFPVPALCGAARAPSACDQAAGPPWRRPLSRWRKSGLDSAGPAPASRISS